MCVQGGYKTLSPIEIANCLHAEGVGLISYRAMRVYFGCLALVAIREAAKRQQRQKGRKPRLEARYKLSEICDLTGLAKSTVRRELRCLERASLLSWNEKHMAANLEPIQGSENLLLQLSAKRSPKRPIPVPRPVLRFVAGCSKPALAKAMLGYVVRGLTIARRSGEISSAGSVKASRLADLLGLSLRSVKSARKALIDSGFISKDIGSFQRKLNRDGAYFQVNLAWNGRGDSGCKIAPPPSKKHPTFAPPYKDKETSKEIKNQKTESAALEPSGFHKEKGGKEKLPLLHDIKAKSLGDYAHLKILYKQAVKARWLAGSEANFLNWVGAAVRATTVSARDPVRLFVSLVKRGQWNFVTQEQEGRARELIRRVRDTSKSAWGAIQNKSLEPELKLSVGEDAQTSFLVRQSRGHLQSSTETLERLQIRKIIEQSFPEIRQRSQL